MASGLLVMALAAAVLFMFSGRYIETDNAYIKSAKILVTPEVSGVIQSVSVTDNQVVKAGDELMRIDPAPYQIALDQAEADLGVTKTHIDELKATYRQKLQ